MASDMLSYGFLFRKILLQPCRITGKIVFGCIEKKVNCINFKKKTVDIQSDISYNENHERMFDIGDAKWKS